MRRPHGSGTVAYNPRVQRWGARLPTSQGRKFLGYYATEQDAHATLDAYLELQEQQAKPKADTTNTLGPYGTRWLAKRTHLRSLRTMRGLWKNHVVGHALGTVHLKDLTRRQLKDWLGDLAKRKTARGNKTLSRQTRVHLLNLVRGALSEAEEDRLIRENPAQRLRVPSEATADEGWTYLRPEQQAALLDTVPTPERWIVEVALYTGCRKGELWCLHLADVHLDDAHPWIWVRYGKREKGVLLPPKNGKPRAVMLNSNAAHALRQWIEQLPRYTKTNPHGLAFPGRFGGFRDVTKCPATWARSLARTGLKMRWHDLRHTCASSLVAGWWGRRWTLQEVSEYLGHSSVSVTERYAHLAESVLRAAVAATGVPIGQVHGAGRNNEKQRSHRVESNHQPTAYKADFNTLKSTAYEHLCLSAAYLARLALFEVRCGRSGYREGRALATVVNATSEVFEVPAQVLEAAGLVLRRDGERSDRITRLCDLVAREFGTKRKVGVA